MRLRPQIGYLALPHAQYYDFSDRKDRIGQACIRQTTRQPSVAVQPPKKDVKKNFVMEQVPN